MVAMHQFTSPAAVRRLLGVAALLGLFAMHGLMDHGTAHAGHAGEPMAVVAAVPDVVDDGQMTTNSTTQTSDGSIVAADRSQEGGIFGLAGLCLAVVLAGVVALQHRRGVVVARRLIASSRALGRPWRVRRDRGPPCLFALSIQRC